MANITKKESQNTSNGFVQLVLMRNTEFFGYITLSERKFSDVNDLSKLNKLLENSGLTAEHKAETKDSAEF